MKDIQSRTPAADGVYNFRGESGKFEFWAIQ